ncbi:MAG: GNAT family N-acetyltransferase [Sulfitobacter sp.]
MILPSGLVLLRRKVAGIPMLMLSRALPPRDLVAQLAQQGVHRLPLLLSPERACTLPRALRIGGRRAMWRLAIAGPEAERRRALHQNWRHQLGQAERSGVRVVHSALAPDHRLLTDDAVQAQHRGYRNWPVPLTQAFARAAPEQTHLFTARLKGHVVAHMLFLRHGTRATYHIGHTTPTGRAHHAHNLILWQAARRLAALGVTIVDLGVETIPEIDRFKRRAGAIPHMTGGTWLRWSPLARGPCP